VGQPAGLHRGGHVGLAVRGRGEQQRQHRDVATPSATSSASAERIDGEALSTYAAAVRRPLRCAAASDSSAVTPAWDAGPASRVRRPAGRSQGHPLAHDLADHDDGRSADRDGVSRRAAQGREEGPLTGSVASCTTASGVSASRPPASRASHTAGSRPTAISSTSVPPRRATASQSTVEPASPGGRCALTTVKDWLTPRAVSGMPALVGPASALEMPGTTSTGIPAATQAATSSIPRANTCTSPPLRRTTRLPERARSTSSASMSRWDHDGPPGVLPTSTTSTSSGRLT
jgi:hypothetical protein